MAESTVRKRTTKETISTTSETSAVPQEKKPSKPKNASAFPFSFLDILRMLGGTAILAVCASLLITNGESPIFGYNHKPALKQIKKYFEKPTEAKVFTEEQLAVFDGKDGKSPIYLAINGKVFDVSANRGTYGPGGSYHFFAGRDATRAYVTGCFKDDLTHDLRGAEDMFLEEDDELDDFLEGKLKTLSMTRRGYLTDKAAKRREKAKERVKAAVNHWETFFENSDKYPYVGKVIRKSLAGQPLRKICKQSMRKRDKQRLEKEEAAATAKKAAEEKKEE